MKCYNVECTNDAEFMIVSMGSTEVNYCSICLHKYQSIMKAIGSPLPNVYPVRDNET